MRAPVPAKKTASRADYAWQVAAAFHRFCHNQFSNLPLNALREPCRGCAKLIDRFGFRGIVAFRLWPHGEIPVPRKDFLLDAQHIANL